MQHMAADAPKNSCMAGIWCTAGSSICGSTLAIEKPSENIMISAMRAKSGTITETGRRRAFKLSGSSQRAAYLGFMVLKDPQAELTRMSCPTKSQRALRSFMACTA